MWNELRFALYAIKKNIQSSAELRTSFLASVVGMAINNSAFIILWVFFVQSVGVINGWTAADIIGLMGFGSLAYGIVFSIAAGLRKTPTYVASGAFDRFLLSPKNLMMRLATSAFSASAVGDIVFGVACLVVYVVLLQASLLQILLLVFVIPLTALMFAAAVIAVSTASFFFVDADSTVRGLLDLFLSPSLFHGGAFQGVTRFVFTFLIPSLVIGALPVEIVRGVSLETLLLIMAITAVWCVLSLKLFFWGVRRYESANFMTFGQ